VTTLSPDNIKVKGDTVELEFVGKSYKNNTASINDKELASYLGQMKDMKKGENFVFDKVNDSTVRRFFHENISPDWKVKDLRTWVATDMGRKVLEQDSTPPPPLPKNPKEAQKLIQNKLTNLYKVVSRRLNNTTAMAKEAYIHPKVTEEWLKKIGAQL
jgi:DNA topoisomerase-1